MADLDKLDKEDVCDPGRWSEKDDQLLQKFEGWVKNRGREGKLNTGGGRMKPTSTPQSYSLQVGVNVVHLTIPKLVCSGQRASFPHRQGGGEAVPSG